MVNFLKEVSNWTIPLIVLLIVGYGYLKGVKVYEVFTEGAAEGINTVLKIFPYLLAMMIAINIFRESGGLSLLVNFLHPLLKIINIPEEVAPLLFLRPLSGSGSLAYTNQIFINHGPDSFLGKLASTIQGSTETTFYIIAIYFGAVGIQKYRHAVIVGLLADLAGFLAAVFICKVLFL